MSRDSCLVFSSAVFLPHPDFSRSISCLPMSPVLTLLPVCYVLQGESNPAGWVWLMGGTGEILEGRRKGEARIFLPLSLKQHLRLCLLCFPSLPIAPLFRIPPKTLLLGWQLYLRLLSLRSRGGGRLLMLFVFGLLHCCQLASQLFHHLPSPRLKFLFCKYSSVSWLDTDQYTSYQAISSR